MQEYSNGRYKNQVKPSAEFSSIMISLCLNLQETSPGLNFKKFARVSKTLMKFSLSEWQFIDPTIKQRNVFVRPGETAGFGPWHRDISKVF